MKKLNFWLFASLLFTAFAVTSCSKDDDEDTPSGPTSIVGKWVGEWPALDEDKRVSQMDDLMWRYAHKLYYYVNADKTIEILESACWYTNESDMRESDLPSISIDPARPNGYYLGERIVHRLTGTYSLSDNKITLNFDREGWGSDEQLEMHDLGEDAFTETYEYKITGNKLRIGDGSLVAASPHNLIIYDEMTWQGK